MKEKNIIDVFADKKYPKLALKLADSYRNALPWEHVVIDDFLPIDVATQLAESYPKPNVLSMLKEDIKPWKYHKNENVDRWLLDNTTEMPESLKMFASAVNSRHFLQFLEVITGIEAILPDPYFLGGGAMVTGTGGFLKVHADFNWNANSQVWRRANALFYLTPDWEKTWGGNLELWTKDGKKKVIEVEPKFNRVVIFSTKSDTYHGQPIPTKTPKGITRNLFSSFYYSSKSSDGIDVDPHFTKYSKTESPYSLEIREEYLKLE